jgi:hypothetical protein
MKCIVLLLIFGGVYHNNLNSILHGVMSERTCENKASVMNALGYELH